MNTLNKLLDKAEKRCTPSNGAELARKIKCSRAAVSLWHKGGTINEKHLAALIDVAAVDPAAAVHVMAEQATTRQEKAVWGALLARVSALGMPIM